MYITQCNITHVNVKVPRPVSSTQCETPLGISLAPELPEGLVEVPAATASPFNFFLCLLSDPPITALRMFPRALSLKIPASQSVLQEPPPPQDKREIKKDFQGTVNLSS